MTGLMPDLFASHGGLLLPLDMFRVSHIAAVMGEMLVGKARNIVDARLVLTRHPASQLVLGRLEGTVVGDDLATFWRDNADLALAVSQVVQRQVFLYYAHPGPGADRREGFLVAQQGQVLAADDATTESIPADSGPEAWPVSRLCEQMGITIDELSRRFEGGPSVEASLMEPRIDDQAAIMTLAGQMGEDGEGGAAAAGGEPTPDPAVEDAKRRAAQQAADEEAARQRAAQVAEALPVVRDDLGIVVAPRAELSEPEILAPFVVSALAGDIPGGLDPSLADELQGKRIDIAVRVEFLSEVFVENKPLSRSAFDERARDRDVGGESVRVLDVLAPRLGYGSLIARDRAYVFVSRRLDHPLPEGLIVQLLNA